MCNYTTRVVLYLSALRAFKLHRSLINDNKCGINVWNLITRCTIRQIRLNSNYTIDVFVFKNPRLS